MVTDMESAMAQFRAAKALQPDAILIFRMGDFYEMFHEDARIASQVLGIPLTEHRSGVPMAGVPYHRIDASIKKLIEAGHGVAICERKKGD